MRMRLRREGRKKIWMGREMRMMAVMDGWIERRMDGWMDG